MKWFMLLWLLVGTSYAATVTASWNYDYSATSSAACTEVITTSCTTGFRVYYVSPKTGYQVTFAYYTNVGTESGVVNGITASGYVGISGADVVVGVAATGKDESGAYIESDPVVITINVPKIRSNRIIIQ